MKILKTYKGMGNHATIEKHTGIPAFKGDTVKAPIYRVTFYSEGAFVYHVSCFETYKEAQNHVKEYPFFEEIKK